MRRSLRARCYLARMLQSTPYGQLAIRDAQGMSRACTGEPFMVRQAHHERCILPEASLAHYAEEIGVNGLVGGDD